MHSTECTIKHRILMMSGASLVGQNVMATLAGRRDTLHLIATNSEAAEPTLFDYDSVHLTPTLGATPETFDACFRNILDQENPDLIVPCRDEDVLYLAGLRQESAADRRNRFLCGTPEAAAAMLDKLLSWEFSSRHGLPFAPTLTLTSSAEQLVQFAAVHGYPLIAKPREGFASRGVFFILNEAQLRKAMQHHGHVIQRYAGDGKAVTELMHRINDSGLPLFHTLEGVKHSVQTLIHPDGSTGPIMATCNKMVFGKSERVWVDPDPDMVTLGQHCARVFSANGWRGPLNIQCERSGAGEIMIYEYNGRFTGATSARYQLGHDEVGMALSHFAGITLPPPPPPAEATQVIRTPTGRVIPPALVQQLQQTAHWPSQPDELNP